MFLPTGVEFTAPSRLSSRWASQAVQSWRSDVGSDHISRRHDQSFASVVAVLLSSDGVEQPSGRRSLVYSPILVMSCPTTCPVDLTRRLRPSSMSDVLNRLVEQWCRARRPSIRSRGGPPAIHTMNSKQSRPRNRMNCMCDNQYLASVASRVVAYRASGTLSATNSMLTRRPSIHCVETCRPNGTLMYRVSVLEACAYGSGASCAANSMLAPRK